MAKVTTMEIPEEFEKILTGFFRSLEDSSNERKKDSPAEELTKGNCIFNSAISALNEVHEELHTKIDAHCEDIDCGTLWAKQKLIHITVEQLFTSAADLIKSACELTDVEIFLHTHERDDD